LKTETRQLTKLLTTACCSTPASPLTEQQLLPAIREIRESLQEFILAGTKPSAVVKNMLYAWQHISNSLYAVQKMQLKVSASGFTELEQLYEWVSMQLHHYQQPGFTHGPVPLLKLVSFKQSLQKAKDCVTFFSATSEEYNIINRHIDTVLASEQVCSFAWVWWSYFCYYVNTEAATGKTTSLNAILTALNFNCSEYMVFLHTTCKHQLNVLDKHEEKIGFLTAELVKYKLLQHTTPVGYHPLAKCVSKTMLSLFKFELHGLKRQGNTPQLNGQIHAGEFSRIETTLSVPQLALLARLLIDVNIIKTGNQGALLKQLAAIFSARGTAAVSPKSLRVNYYEPAFPAKNIVKDHLFAMLNQLKKY